MPPTDLDFEGHEELQRVFAAGERQGRTAMLQDLVAAMRGRMMWPGADLFIEMLSGMVDCEALRAAGTVNGHSGPRLWVSNGHLTNGSG